MLQNMIKATARMLKESQDPKVVCARELLEEIVEGMGVPTETGNLVPTVQVSEPRVEAPAPKV